MTQLCEPVGCKVVLQTGVMSQAAGAYYGQKGRDATAIAALYGHQEKEDAA